MRLTLIIASIIWIVAACVPTTSPPQLLNTPGPGVRVMDRVYDSGTYRVEYPATWQVITSAAGDTTPHVIFAAPEGDALILLGENITDAPPPAAYEGELRSETRDVPLSEGRVLRAILNAAPDHWAEYESIFSRVLASIQ